MVTCLIYRARPQFPPCAFPASSQLSTVRTTCHHRTPPLGQTKADNITSQSAIHQAIANMPLSSKQMEYLALAVSSTNSQAYLNPHQPANAYKSGSASTPNPRYYRTPILSFAIDKLLRPYRSTITSSPPLPVSRLPPQPASSCASPRTS